MALKGTLIKEISKIIAKPARKVTVIGAGNVGMAIVSCLIGKCIATEICLVDKKENLIHGEVKDLLHGAALLNNAKLAASSSYECSKDSDICIITAGEKCKTGKCRMKLLDKNVPIMQDVVKNVVKYNPCTTLIIASNPVDVLTYVAWKESGLPFNRVIGCGTILDSSRLRSFIAQRLCVSPASVYATVIGENGYNAVTCWSGVTIGNTLVRTVYPDFGKESDPEKWVEVHKKVIQSDANLIGLKGATWWGLGLCVAYLTSCILDNSYDIAPVTTNVKGFHGIEDDIFLSLPCVLGLNGVQGIVNQKLDTNELKNLAKSAELLKKFQDKTDILKKD